MDAGKANIETIFNRSRILKVPHFQRPYVWKVDLWERFLEDMKYASNSKETYFMGAIILKKRDTPSSERIGDVRDIIDGQQRLTTLTLFFKALHQINQTENKFRETFKTHEEDLILKHNYFDRGVFEKILLDEELNENEKESRIYQCYKYFLDNISKNEINHIKVLANILFVLIDLGTEEDEQQIFDTINSLGVSLTTAELLKNYLFNEDLESYEKNWKDIFEDEKVRGYWEQEVTSGRFIRTNLDIFLESYLFIKIQDKKLKVNSEDKKRFFKIDSVFNSYKELIKKYKLNKKIMIKELKEYAILYKDNILPKIIKNDVGKENFKQRLNLVIFGLDTATIIPYTLYLSKNVKEEEEKNKIFRYLEAYLMRRIISRATNKNYNQLFRESLINNKINSLTQLKDFIGKKVDRTNYMPTDGDVKKGFSESILTNKQTRGILYLIETAIRNERHSTELKFLNEYSLEHLLPKKWRNNWDKKNSLTEEQKNERDEILLTIGNLTLITKQLNSSIRDADWKTKKKGIGKHKGLNEYARGMDIFQSKYLDKESWNEEVIQKRAKELSEHAINSVWKLDFE